MSATRNPRKRKGRSKKQFVEEAWAKRAPKMPSHSYGPRKGLEGPFQYRSGKVLYWDAKEGAYYDPGADMYLSSKDAQAFIINPRKRKNPGCRDARGFVPTPQCRGQQKAILLFFHEMKRSDPKFTLKDAWEISKGKKPVTKLSKKTLAKAKRDAPVAEQTALAFNPRKRKNPGKFFVVVDTSVPGGKWGAKRIWVYDSYESDIATGRPPSRKPGTHHRKAAPSHRRGMVWPCERGIDQNRDDRKDQPSQAKKRPKRGPKRETGTAEVDAPVFPANRRSPAQAP